MHGCWENRIQLGNPCLQKETWKELEDRKPRRETEACRRTGFLSILSNGRGFSFSQKAGTGALRYKPILSFLL